MTTRQSDGYSLRSVGQSASILIGATLAVQVIGILRELFVAAQIGLSSELDALIIGIALPATMATVLTAGARAALVPAYMELHQVRGSGDARRLAGTVLTWATIAGAVLAALLWLLADPLVTLMGPGLDEVARDSAIGYLQLVAPAAIALAAMSVLFAVCQAEKEFGILGAAILVGPITTLIIMLVLWSELGVTALAVGSLIGPFASIALLLVTMALRRISPRPRLVSRGLGLGGFAQHAAPLSASALILQLNPIIDRAIATLITPGGVSALRYGDSLLRAPIAALNSAWSAALYPALVASTRDEGDAGLGSSTERTLRFTVALFVPVALLLVAVAPVAVFVVYGRGEFGAQDVQVVASVLAAYAPMIFIIMANEVLTSALNARRRGMVLLAAGSMNVVLNLVLDVVFGISFGVVGIALSSTITAAIVTTWKAQRFVRSEAGIDLPSLFGSLGRATAAAAPAALVIGVWTRVSGLPGGTLIGIVELAIFGVVGLGSYVLLASRLGLHEPRALVDFGANRVWERLRPGTTG